MKKLAKEFKTIKLDKESYDFLDEIKGDDSYAKLFRKLIPLSKKLQNQIMTDQIEWLELFYKQNNRAKYNDYSFYLIFELWKAMITQMLFDKDVAPIVQILKNYAEDIANKEEGD